jgi:hypothetical protein
MSAIVAAHIWDFPWGKWIVNANTTQQVVELSGTETLRLAVPGASAKFAPLDANPLNGSWTSTAATTPLQLPALSQVILINPDACPTCLGAVGDYNDDGQVSQLDYNTWRTMFDSSQIAADGNLDGVVNAADYVLWRRALGDAASKAAALSAVGIPEPATAMLGLISATSVVVFYRSPIR